MRPENSPSDLNLNENLNPLYERDFDNDELEGLAIGIKTVNGVVLARISETSPLRVDEEGDGSYRIISNAMSVAAGQISDANQIADMMRECLAEERKKYGGITNYYSVIKNVGGKLQSVTQKYEMRPYRAEMLIGGLNNRGDSFLYSLQYDGNVEEWNAYSIGEKSSEVMKQLEKSYNTEIKVSEGYQIMTDIIKNLYGDDLDKYSINIFKISQKEGIEECDMDAT